MRGDRAGRTHEYLVAFVMIATVAAARLLARITTIEWTLRMFTRPTRREGKCRPLDIQRRIEILNALTRRFEGTPLRISCFERSLILQRLLALCGIPGRVVLGVQLRSKGVMRSHAWVENEGRPILDPAASQYRRVFSFGPG